MEEVKKLNTVLLSNFCYASDLATYYEEEDYDEDEDTSTYVIKRKNIDKFILDFSNFLKKKLNSYNVFNFCFKCNGFVSKGTCEKCNKNLLKEKENILNLIEKYNKEAKEIGAGFICLHTVEG